MKLRNKITLGLAVVVTVAFVSLAGVLSYTSECGPAPVLADGAERMQAIRYQCYGAPDVLQLVDAEKPVPADDEVLVRVEAAAVNPLDYHYMRGTPYFIRLMSGIGAPKDTRLGVDFAGVVEAVGRNVTNFQVGDAVFGAQKGAYAEYLVKHHEGSIAHLPENVDFSAAAAVPIAAVTAYQAVIDHGRVKAGQHVLVNGASGGVGTFAVQIAKSLGATVTGVCSARNREMVLSIGADQVIDYREANYTEGQQEYDVVIDMIGNHPQLANLGVLKPDGRLVIVGGEKGNWLGPLGAMAWTPFVRLTHDQEIVRFVAKTGPDVLESLADLMASGEVTPVIDRRYSLAEVPKAIEYSESGRARGKIVVEIR